MIMLEYAPRLAWKNNYSSLSLSVFSLLELAVIFLAKRGTARWHLAHGDVIVTEKWLFKNLWWQPQKGECQE